MRLKLGGGKVFPGQSPGSAGKTRLLGAGAGVGVGALLLAVAVQGVALRLRPQPPRPPLGLPPVPWPAENPYTPEKAELGRLLFFDKRLSSDGTVACASCHLPERAFADQRAVSEGI
ncbi:MAG: hypothetical protein FJX77_02680, partial [Armatimonadetes bacterium]|nr:hypothetical protein [Armatimonadota bacterium]